MKNGNQFIFNVTSPLKNLWNNSSTMGGIRSTKPIHLVDFEEAIQSVLPTQWSARAYSHMNGGQSLIFDGDGNGPSSNRMGSVAREVHGDAMFFYPFNSDTRNKHQQSDNAKSGLVDFEKDETEDHDFEEDEIKNDYYDDEEDEDEDYQNED